MEKERLYGYRSRSSTLMQNNVIGKFTRWQGNKRGSVEAFSQQTEAMKNTPQPRRYCVWHYQIE